MVLNECICPGHEELVEDSLCGAFDCDESANQIQLRHSQFEHGTLHLIAVEGTFKLIGIHMHSSYTETHIFMSVYI